ncbi:hypothetical protein GKZ89_14290 [Bacillus mangrovi]|uniref:RDD domain-containing protein n=1 Tax=Metabacillus mangrovi TaxID=1491830 RepID=A0A7X2V5L1_9BACI|nr:RDD family protein [Metabacillus mangrovi]MTH54570.1 hypothetical protein [Metabacillus mangrovi]
MQAGFWKRAGAYMIDGIIVGVLTFLFLLLIGAAGMALDSAGIQKESFESIVGVLGVAVYLSIPWLYTSFFHSSRLQATPGKMAVSIIVVSEKGLDRISFWKATVRYLSSILSGLIFFFGYIMAGLTKHKQALHDLLADTYVVEKGSVSRVEREAV